MDMSASSSNFSYKTLNSLKKDQLIKLILEQQKDASKSECFTDGADSLNTSSRVLSPNAHSSDLMSVSTVKSFIVDAVRELKEELTLDFNQRFSSLSEEVTRLRSDVDIFSKEFYTYREAIKADLLSELKELERRKNNAIIFGLPESSSSLSEDLQNQDSKLLEDLNKKMNLPSDCVKTFFRLGKKANGRRPRPLKVVFVDSRSRNDFLQSSTIISRPTTNANGDGDEMSPFHRIFIKPDLSPREQEIDKQLRFDLKRRREDGERVVIRGGKIVPQTSFSRN